MSEQLGMSVKKKENFSEWYTEVIQKSEMADIRYNVKGFLVHRPWSVRIMKKMYELLEKDLEAGGHEPVWFPAVIPESNFKKEAEHVKGFAAEVFWITEGGSEGKKIEERLVLRPTSETAMYSMFSLWVRSYRDLPLKTYQSCQVWRYEGKATRPFIRGREFFWIETHNVFATKEESENQVKEDMKTTERVIHGDFGLPFIFFKRPEHDKFAGAVSTFAADTIMPDGKILQLPSTHLLGQNFSKPFNVKFLDKDGKEKYGWTTCYGPAVWRILGGIIAIHGDDKGLIIPPRIAPFHVVIVPIIDQEKKAVLNKAKEISQKLESNNISVKIDSREEYTPGWKFNHWELRGVPIRLEVGPKDIKKNQVILVRRDDGRKMEIKEEDLTEKIKIILDDIQIKITQKAEKFFNEHISSAKNVVELKKILKEKGGLIRIEWCGEVSCADEIKTETGADIRGTDFSKEEKPKGNCIKCGKKAKEVVYAGRSY